ncbi:MAG TPA: A24 family peptidase [Acidimicrobiales bacterium]|nr:A24 family peptidase [Acidimicrobiales bacterium]
MHALVTGVSAAGGLVLGDGLEVLVERMGARLPMTRPWWRCQSCATPARGLALVPVARSLTLRSGCPSCGQAVAHPWRPAVLAVVSAAVLGSMAARIGADAALAPFAVLGLSLVAISAVDLERQIIPNRLIYPTLALLIPLLVVASAVDHRWGALTRAAIAGGGAFAAFYAVHIAVPRGMGFGDVRLAGVIGAATGWLGLGRAFVGFLAAFVLGSVLGVVAMAVTGAGRKTKIPFGPFLAAGAWLTVLWGGPVAHALFQRGA